MSFVQDVTEQTFEQAVLAKSREVPVVVDFWAAWCAPCRMLGPTLEREVNALGGRVLLAKLDVDQAQALSQQYGVQGIPAVMAFRDGKVVADFVGARDAGFLRTWLSTLSPSEAQQALSSAKDEASLRALISSPEVGPAASLQLAELLLAGGRAGEAATLLAPLRGDKAEALQRLVAFATDAETYGGAAKAEAALAQHPGDLEARWALACDAAARGDDARALEGFLDLVTTSRKYRDDGARKAMVTLFERLGPQHALTREYRRRLQSVL